MKNIMIFANVNGNMKLLIDAMEFEKERTELLNAVCLGNFPVMCKSTRQGKFYPKGPRLKEATKVKQYFNKQHRGFPLSIYALHGRYDDRLIPAFAPYEIKSNITQVVDSTVLPFKMFKSQPTNKINYIPTTKTFYVGVMGGYYSPELWADVNKSKQNGLREKSSNALCEIDFSIFHRQIIDFLMTFEAPHKYNGANQVSTQSNFVGSERITKLVKECATAGMHFHAGAGEFSIGYIDETLSLGVPKLEDGYLSLDVFEKTVEVVRHNNGNFAVEKTLKNALRIW